MIQDWDELCSRNVAEYSTSILLRITQIGDSRELEHLIVPKNEVENELNKIEDHPLFY